MRLRSAATAAALLALVGGCASRGGAATTGSGTTATTAGATTTGAATTVAAGRPAPPPGSAYADPDGTYTITVAPGWTERSGTLVKDIEAWIVAPAANGFVANVNVLTHDADGMDLDAYLAFTLQHMGTFTVVAHDVTVGAGGRPLGRIEYAGTPSGSTRALHLLATIDVRGTHAVVATLTAEEAAFAGLRPDVEPYLLTLWAT